MKLPIWGLIALGKELEAIKDYTGEVSIVEMSPEYTQKLTFWVYVNCEDFRGDRWQCEFLLTRDKAIRIT